MTSEIPINPGAIVRTLIMAWISAIAVGTFALWQYDSEPGPAGHRNPTLASQARSELDEPNRFKICVFLHPRCPCSVATVRELERMLSLIAKPIDVHAYLYCPRSETESWTKVGAGEVVRKIPGMNVTIDWDADLARQLGVETSGHLLVYSPSSELGFTGGITTSRGHEGDSAGKLHILSIINNGVKTGVLDEPVYGCPLFSAEIGKGVDQ